MKTDIIRRELYQLKEMIKQKDFDCPYLKFDKDYMIRLIEGTLTPEEKREHDKIEAMTGEELHAYFTPKVEAYRQYLIDLGCIKD